MRVAVRAEQSGARTVGGPAALPLRLSGARLRRRVDHASVGLPLPAVTTGSE